MRVVLYYFKNKVSTGNELSLLAAPVKELS